MDGQPRLEEIDFDDNINNKNEELAMGSDSEFELSGDDEDNWQRKAASKLNGLKLITAESGTLGSLSTWTTSLPKDVYKDGKVKMLAMKQLKVILKKRKLKTIFSKKGPKQR